MHGLEMRGITAVQEGGGRGGGACFLHATTDIVLQKYIQAPIESEDSHIS
jgi:hypothetical protein